MSAAPAPAKTKPKRVKRADETWYRICEWYRAKYWQHAASEAQLDDALEFMKRAVYYAYLAGWRDRGC